MSIIYLYLLLSFIGICFSTVTVAYPNDLVNKFKNPKLKAEYASFGKVPYRFFSRGQVFIDTSVSEISNGCKPIPHGTISMGSKRGDNYPILLLKRGKCTFVTKARHAQEAGANMVIIVNDQPGRVDHIIMADDGTGIDIFIPTLMITQEEGNIIYNYIINNKKENVILEIEFDADVTEKVKVEIFYSSSERRAYSFLNNIHSSIEAFGDKVELIPRYVLYKSPYYDPNIISKQEHCVSSGRYCYFPKGTAAITDGRAIVLEDLRQGCMYRLSNGTDGYYQYMNQFYDSCYNLSRPIFTSQCSESALELIGYNKNYLSNCIKESFGINVLKNEEGFENDNSVLKDDYNAKEDYLITKFPSVYINKQPLLGAIKEAALVEAICLAVLDPPEFCEYYLARGKLHTGKSLLLIGLIFLGIVLVNILIVLICRKYIQNRISRHIEEESLDLDGRINNVVNNYFKLKDSSTSRIETKTELSETAVDTK